MMKNVQRMFADPVELLLQDSSKPPRRSKRKVKENKEIINLQDLFNKISLEHGTKKAKEEEKKPIETSPKSLAKAKRLAAWEAEDSDDEDSEPHDANFPSCSLCMICNQEFSSPEATKKHMNLTRHQNFEMVTSLQAFLDEFDHSHTLRKQGSKDWEEQLKAEFRQIFDQLDDKVYGLFKAKIGEKSLFLNVDLKLEIFTFILAQEKVYKCNYCEAEAFGSLEDLEAHVAKKKKCKFTEAQKYLF